MEDVNVLRQACRAFRNLFWKLVKIDPFRQPITKFFINNEVFRTMFLKPDSVGIIPRGCYRMGIARLLRHFNCRRTLVGRVAILFMPVMEGTFIWLGSLLWKLLGSVQRLRKTLSNSASFDMGVWMPNRHKHIGKTEVTLQNRNGKLWRGCRKSRTPIIMLFRSWGVSLKNCCAKLLALKMKFALTPMCRMFLQIFEMLCMG